MHWQNGQIMRDQSAPIIHLQHHVERAHDVEGACPYISMESLVPARGHRNSGVTYRNSMGIKPRNPPSPDMRLSHTNLSKALHTGAGHYLLTQARRDK